MKLHRMVLIMAVIIFALTTTACGRNKSDAGTVADSNAQATNAEAQSASQDAAAEEPPPTAAAIADEDTQELDTTLRLLYPQGPDILNPHLVTGDKEHQIVRLVYEPLASFDGEGQLVPILAAEIPSLDNEGVAPDGKSVTWRLKPDLKWSDGEPVTAEDVRFTYEYITNPEVNSATASTYAPIERVEVVDELTIRLHFAAAYPAWTILFSGLAGGILPEHVFAEYNNAQSRDAPANLNPVGTGPYRLVEWKTEDILLIGEDVVNITNLIFEPNPHYRAVDQLFFQQVEVQGGGDTQAAAQAVLANGAVDYVRNLQVSTETLAELEADGTGYVVVAPSSWVERIYFNFTDPNRETETGERSNLQFPHPFFTDKLVRQAFAHAIDRAAIAALYGKAAEPTTNILVEPAIYASPNTADLYPYDPERAAALLDEAGWHDSDGDGIRDKDGIKMSVLFQTSVNEIRQQTQEVVKAELEAIGVEVELKAIDASIFFSTDPTQQNNHQHFHADLQEYFDNNYVPEPDAYMGYWTCDEIPQEANAWSGHNDSRWCSEAYDTLHSQLIVEIDPEKRRELIIGMNDILIEEAIVLPLVNRATVSGFSNSLAGFELTPWDSELWNIHEWRRE